MEDKRPSWSSRTAFILAAVGSAVGLGNIWRFPYIMGENGGAIFLLIYLILILTVFLMVLTLLANSNDETTSSKLYECGEQVTISEVL